MRQFLAMGLLVMAALVILTACGSGSEAKSSPTVNPALVPTQDPDRVWGTPGPTRQVTRVPVGDAPAPAKVDAKSLSMIEEWKARQIPAYPGATRDEWVPEQQATVKDGGRMLYRTSDSVEQVLAFYRGALRATKWDEQAATGQQIVAQSKDAALTISVVNRDGATLILMMLTDAH